MTLTATGQDPSDEPSARSLRIAQIINNLVGERRRGLAIDAAAVEAAYPDLMPELGRRLRIFRAMEQAGVDAEDGVRFAESEDWVDDYLNEQREYLNERLADYEVFECIHHGGQGAVYRAFHTPTQRTVALKILLAGPLASTRQRERLEREVSLTARLRHPNIVTVFSKGDVGGHLYFAMEYIEGVALDEHCALERPPLADRIRLFLKVCRAVGYAHRYGVIHRDLKPGNILVDHDGEPHVLDFGLAIDTATSSRITEVGQVVGTIQYASPEQASGAEDSVDVRTDVYSLGVILFQLLTGGFPYSVDGPSESIRRRIRESEPARLRQVIVQQPSEIAVAARELTDDIEAILAKALEKEKSQRYLFVDMLAEDLECFLDGRAVSARRHSTWYVARKALRKHRRTAALVAAALFILTTSSALVTVFWLRARSDRDYAMKTLRMTHATYMNVITEFDDVIARLAGGTQVRNDSLPRFSRDLAQIIALAEEDVSMRDVLAATLEKKGDIAERLGQAEEAAGHYRQAVNTARELSMGDDACKSRALLIRCLSKLAWVARDAEIFEEALAAGSSSAVPGSGACDLEFELANAHLLYARYHSLSGANQAGSDQTTKAIDIIERQEPVEDWDDRWHALLAEAHHRQGVVYKELDLVDKAILEHRAALDIQEALASARPADVQLRLDILDSYASLGALTESKGGYHQALQHFDNALSIGSYLVHSEPNNAEWKQALFRVLHDCSRTAQAAEQMPRAGAYVDRLVDVADELLKMDEGNPLFRRYKAFAYSRRARFREGSGEFAGAYHDLIETTRIFGSLLSVDPDNVRLIRELTATHDGLGDICKVLGDEEQRFEHYSKAYDLRLAALNSVPQGSTYLLVQLAMSHINLADWHLCADVPSSDAKAREHLDDASETLLRLPPDARNEHYLACMNEIERLERRFAQLHNTASSTTGL